MAISWLSDDVTQFPDLDLALPDGLLAAGGDLSHSRLLSAYRQGIFPWYSDNSPILWWSPDPRMVLYPEQLHISKSLRKLLKQNRFNITIDNAFTEVMIACAQPRDATSTDGSHTWIQSEMVTAYTDLYQRGHAHSVECWLDNELVGGLYGVNIGQVFFGESMFSLVPNSSKLAFATLCQFFLEWDIRLIDCQIYSDHLASLGAVEVERQHFIDELTTFCSASAQPTAWQF